LYVKEEMKTVANKNLIVKVIHRDDDPVSWLVHVYEPAFLFKKKVMSKIFNSGEEAKRFVEKLKFEEFMVK